MSRAPEFKFSKAVISIFSPKKVSHYSAHDDSKNWSSTEPAEPLYKLFVYQINIDSLPLRTYTDQCSSS